MIAQVHTEPKLTIAAGIFAAIGLLWYWFRLGEIDLTGRRWVRRFSVAVMIMAIPNLVRGLSFIDADRDGGDYIVSWTTSIGLLGIVLVTAFIDLGVTYVEQRRVHLERMNVAGRRLVDALDTLESRGDDGS